MDTLLKKQLTTAGVVIGGIALIAIVANSSNESVSYFAPGLIIIAITILLIFLLREVVCWYFKINKQVEQNAEIIRLLKQIANANKNNDDFLNS